MSRASRSAALNAEHAARQQAIAADVKQQILRLWGVVDPRNVDAAWPAVSRALSEVIARGHASSVQAAAAYLRDHAHTAGITLADIAQASTLDAGQLETALRVTGPIAVKTAAASGLTPAAASASAAVQLVGAASRLVQSGGRETIVKTVDASGQIVGYRRTAGGGRSCYFCAMLISRGAVYKSHANASTTSGTRGTQPQGRRFHDHCNCGVEPLYAHEDEPPEVAALYQRYLDATARKSGPEAVQAWRQAYEAETAAPAVVESQIIGRDLTALSDDDLTTLLHGATDEAEIDHVIAELDRRDEVARAEQVAAAAKANKAAADKARREAKIAARDAELDDAFNARLDAGQDPESAYADVYGTSVEQQRRDAAIASMRSNGYKGKNFDELSRNAFREHLAESYINAENATRGALFRGPAGRVHTQDEVDRLFNGSEAYARANASEELLAYWHEHGRLTLEDFRASMLGGQLKEKGRAAWY